MNKPSQPGLNKDARRGLFILCTAAFLVPYMGSSMSLALPDISRTFQMKAVTLTWLPTAYLIATAVCQIPFARMADLIGRKRVFTWGVLLFTCATALCAVAPNSASLIALRVFSGVGSAMMFGTNIAIITSLFPPESRGKALAINAAVVYAALAAGPFVGGMLTHYFGWQSIFYVPAVIGLVVVVLTPFCMKGEWIEARGERFDFIGSLLFGLGLAAVIYGFSTLEHLSGVAFLVGGAIVFWLFVSYEKRQTSPVFNVHLFRGNRVFTLSSLAALINYAATSGIAFMLSLYLQYVRGFDARQAGLILITQACIQSACSLVAGRLMSRFAPASLATAGMAVSVVALSGLVFVGTQTPIWQLIILLLLLGIGFGIFSSPNTFVIMGAVDKKYYTQASATTGTVRLTGQAFSLGIAGMAISVWVGNKTIVPELYPAFMQSMRLTFIVFLILCCLGVYASSVRSQRHRIGT